MFNSFRGYKSELSFIQFVIQSAPKLKKMRIVLAGGEPDQKRELITNLMDANANEAVVLEIAEGDGGDAWCFRQASDPLVFDPFNY